MREEELEILHHVEKLRWY